MEFNDFIFPAPKPSYTNKLSGLYFIDTNVLTRSQSNYTTMKEVQKGIVKVSLNEQEKPLQKKNRITTLLQLEEFICNGIILFFHGNAEDIGMCKSFAYVISAEFKMASLCMEYPGYGLNDGKCCSDSMIQNAYRVMEHILFERRVNESKIIIIGRSIGTSLAIEMSLKYQKIKSLILLSPFTSLRDVIEENSFSFVSKLVKERFRNLEKMKRVNCPTLIIHGKQDKLISYKHSIKLMNQCSGIVDLRLFDGMTHNSFLIELHILSPLRQFLHQINDQQFK